MKKKILILNYQMLLGGVCIAAKNFIENMKQDYEIEYMLAKANGELDNRLPKDVAVSYIPYPLNLAARGKKECTTSGMKIFVDKTIMWLIANVFHSPCSARRTCKHIKNEKQYDIVINNDMDASLRRVGACHAYAKHVAKAPIKVLILHGDFIANNYDVKFFKKEYIPSYNYIAVLSNALKKQLEELFPKSKDKFIVIPNFAAVDEIKALSNEMDISFDRKTLNIVSASRLVEVKAIMRSLRVFKRLRDEGFDFCWNILGEGEQRPEIEEFIKENKLENNVKLLGLQKNPYPYMKEADLLYLGSYHESYGLVLIESMICGKPVVTTNTISAKEIVDEKYGWICDNDEEGIYNTFKFIIENPKELESKTNNLKKYEFDNKSIKKKYDDLIGR